MKVLVTNLLQIWPPRVFVNELQTFSSGIAARHLSLSSNESSSTNCSQTYPSLGLYLPFILIISLSRSTIHQTSRL